MSDESADFATIDQLMKALYDSISGPPGGQDFELSRRLQHPDVRLVRTRLDESGKPLALSFSGDEYEANAKALLAGMPFYEVETARRTVRFGNIAQVFSSYEARHKLADPAPFLRAINSMQLLNDGKRWWVLTVAWSPESIEHPLPKQYSEKAGR